MTVSKLGLAERRREGRAIADLCAWIVRRRRSLKAEPDLRRRFDAELGKRTTVKGLKRFFNEWSQSMGAALAGDHRPAKEQADDWTARAVEAAREIIRQPAPRRATTPKGSLLERVRDPWVRLASATGRTIEDCERVVNSGPIKKAERDESPSGAARAAVARLLIIDPSTVQRRRTKARKRSM